MRGNGKYFDGERPLSIPVLFFSDDKLFFILHAETKASLVVWEVAYIKEDEEQNVVKVLKNTRGHDKLEILYEEDSIEFKSHAFEMKGPPLFKLGVLFTIVVLLFAVFWFTLPKISQQIAYKIPLAQEKKWSAKLALSPLNRYSTCTLTPNGQKALDKIVSRIYPIYKEDQFGKLEINFVSSPQVNAFTFPGGKIFVLTGLVDKVKTAEEFAGVLAHEIEHIRKRHISAMLVRSSFLTFVFHFLSGDFTSVFAVDPSTALSVASLSFDRDMETEADKGALERMRIGKINPHHFSNLFLHTPSIPSRLNFLNNHPTNEARIAMINQYPDVPSMPLLNDDEWKAIKYVCFSSALKDSNKNYEINKKQIK